MDSARVFLFAAARDGDLPLFRALVCDSMESVETITDLEGDTILHGAAMGNGEAVGICKYLVEEVKMDVNLKHKKSRWTPLHIATIERASLTVEYLVENGAYTSAEDLVGNTPAHFAAKLGHLDILEYFITKGADVEAVSKFGRPLHIAALANQAGAVELLLRSNADPNAESPEYHTPLISSIIASSPDCVKLLLEKEVDAELNMLSGITPLVMAAYKGSASITELLLQFGANPNAESRGLKAIVIAAAKNNINVVKVLLPVTDPCKTDLSWSESSIISHAQSAEIKSKLEEAFTLAKSKGKDAFERKDYRLARFWCTEAIRDAPNDDDTADLLYLRSACSLRLEMAENSLVDAFSCLNLKPNCHRAYYRVGKAFMQLEDFGAAASFFKSGLTLIDKRDKRDKRDKDEKELKRAYSKAALAYTRSLSD